MQPRKEIDLDILNQSPRKRVKDWLRQDRLYIQVLYTLWALPFAAIGWFMWLCVFYPFPSTLNFSLFILLLLTLMPFCLAFIFLGGALAPPETSWAKQARRLGGRFEDRSALGTLGGSPGSSDLGDLLLPILFIIFVPLAICVATPITILLRLIGIRGYKNISNASRLSDL